MKAMREVSQQDVPWGRPQWWRRAFEVRARAERLSRLSQEQSIGNTSNGALWQFARFCVVGTSNAIIDFGVLNAALAAFPTKATVPLLAYNTAAVVLAATNSFVWNRRFTFRVRGPLQAGEVARFAVVAAGTAGLNDLVLLLLSAVFPALMGSGTLGANVLKLGAILGRWPFRFSAYVSGCLSVSGCHLLLLRKQGVCLHPPRRRTGLAQTAVFKHRCTLILSSSIWRYI